MATTNFGYYKQYTVAGPTYSTGNDVAALSNYSVEKTLHEYLMWYDANWKENGVTLHKKSFWKTNTGPPWF